MVLFLKDFLMTDRVALVRALEGILTEKITLGDVKNQVAVNDRNFANMLILSSLRQLTFIKQEVLPLFVKKKIPHKQQILKYILYLGTTELLFLNTPDYAVINSYVDTAKQLSDNFSARFINAILRNIAKNKATLLENRKVKYFSKDFWKILSMDYTSQQIREMEELAITEPPLDLSLKANSKIHFENEILLPCGSLRLPYHTKIIDLDGYKEGLWWVQDAASALPIRCLADIKGKSILDVCAAPGGKTAQLLDAGAMVTAVDVSQARLNRLKENMERLNFNDNLQITHADARHFVSDDKFDIILLDAPCSATGTFRRHPEIIHTKTIDDVLRQAQLQKEILDHIIKFLAPNGILVYATCSLAKSEGESQIYDFLHKHSDFKILPISLSYLEEARTKEGFLRILPQYFKQFGGIDGFFVALLQRKI